MGVTLNVYYNRQIISLKRLKQVRINLNMKKKNQLAIIRSYISHGMEGVFYNVDYLDRLLPNIVNIMQLFLELLKRGI